MILQDFTGKHALKENYFLVNVSRGILISMILMIKKQE